MVGCTVGLHTHLLRPFNETRFNINTSYYKNPGRWDCIYSIPAPGATKENERDGYPRYGFWTASPKGGTMGFGVTHDGWNWEALPTPEIHPVIEAEVGAVEHVAYGPSKEKSAWYAILGYDHRMVTYSVRSNCKIKKRKRICWC